MNTERTILRPWDENDARDLYEVFASPQAMRFWNAPSATSVGVDYEGAAISGWPKPISSM